MMVRADDVPQEWHEAKAPICGLSWHLQDRIPLPNIASCCTSKPEVKNACFHYCATDLDPSAFLDCVDDLIGEDAPIFGCQCNFDGSSWQVGVDSAIGSGWMKSVNEPGLWLILAIMVLVCVLWGREPQPRRENARVGGGIEEREKSERSH